MRDASRLARGWLLPRFVALGGGEAAERRFSTAAAHAVIIVAEKGTARLLARGAKSIADSRSTWRLAPTTHRFRTNSARSTSPLMPSNLQSISCASPVRRIDLIQIGRASCRESECQYV